MVEQEILTEERTGMMVTPEWPPMTVTLVEAWSAFFSSLTKVLARTMSKVVTPKTL
jgi:hypothetical protein